MFNVFAVSGFSDTAVTFFGAMCFRPPAIRMHGVYIVRNIMGRSDVYMTERGIAIQILKVKKRVEMMDAEVVAIPRRCGSSPEQVT